MTKPFILLTGDDSVRSEGIILILMQVIIFIIIYGINSQLMNDEEYKMVVGVIRNILTKLKNNYLEQTVS